MTTPDSITARIDAIDAAREVWDDTACGLPYNITYVRCECRLAKGHDHDCATANAIRRSLPTIDRGLVEALRKVVALHQPIQMLTGPVCTSCGDADEHGVEWPCLTLASLADALGCEA